MKEKRAVIMGATSGLGREVAKLLLQEGWRIGVAGRREEKLRELQALAPDRVEIEVIDIMQEGAYALLDDLMERVGDVDLYFHSSGIGYQNIDYDWDREKRTIRTNVDGFTRMMLVAYEYFWYRGKGHIAVISSVAGTKGMGAAPSYSASKRFQSTYIDALAQHARLVHANVRFTDIRPGFVATDLLGDKPYPLLMKPEKVARQIVKALHRKKRVAVIDWRYRVLVGFWRLIPRWLWERLPVKN